MKKTIGSATALVLTLLTLLGSLPLLQTNISYGQPSDMTFTSGDRIGFTSTVEMAIKSPLTMDFGSNQTMNFTSGTKMQFIDGNGDGLLMQCDWIQIVYPGGYLPDPCSWWEVLDPSGKPTGWEFHIDLQDPPFFVHVDQTWPPTGPIPAPAGTPIWAEKKIDGIYPCEYYEVHWPAGWYPAPCTWWELMDPETGLSTGVEFHVDWTNESCEFHIDEVLPGPYPLPFPWHELQARRKTSGLQPCDYFVVNHPIDWWPDPCTWWEVLDPRTWEPSGIEFHVDWSNESCEFHIDQVIPGPIEFPWVPTIWVRAQQKIADIQPCDWFVVVDPQGFLPERCSWWEIIDAAGVPTGLEFHVDTNDGVSLFHVDAVAPGTVITIPPSYTVTVRKKIDAIQQCSWFKVNDPALTPAPCSWWEVLDPTTGNPTGWEFHIDVNDPVTGWFHVDTVFPGPAPILPTHVVIAEKKIDDIQACDWFLVVDPAGWVPEPCSWWEIVTPTEWAGVTFHVDINDGVNMFHIDFADRPPTIIPPPYSVTARPYEPPPPPWYKKPPYPDYAPSGMPDFDQKQDKWGPAVGIYTWCGPVAVANSIWWFDSKYDPSNLVPNFGTWDDHDPRNVDPLVQYLAFLMDTDGIRTGLPHTGTGFIDMETGISQYLQAMGINPIGDCDGDGDVDGDDIAIINAAMSTVPGAPGWDMRADIIIDNRIDMNDYNAAMANFGLTGMFYEHTVEFPDFRWIEDEIYRCEDVVLFLEFWLEMGPGEWMPLYDNPSLESGHYVTAAGVNSTTFELLISDPYIDGAEAGNPGDVPIPHPPHADPTVHNDTRFVSHDAYPAAFWVEPPPSPYPGMPVWELVGYLQALGYPVGWHAFIRAAVVTSPLAVPDVAVTNVTTSKDGCTPMPTVSQGYTANITVTVENQGSTVETFNVTAYGNVTKIGEQTVVALAPGANTTLTFIWDTTGWSIGNYLINAEADIIAGETDTADNKYDDGIVKVTIPGDVDGSDKVDMRDIGAAGRAFGSTPASPNWNPNADINNDGKVDMRDIGIMARNFGASYP